MQEAEAHSIPYLPTPEADGASALAHAKHGDIALTADRKELKFLVSREQLSILAPCLDTHLERYKFKGKGSTQLPGADFWTTTVYFDTDSHQLYWSAVSGKENTKIRAREYYTLHPALTELATSPEQLVRYSQQVWVEVKTRKLSQVKKYRVVIPKQDLRDFMLNPMFSEELVRLQPGFAATPDAARAEVAAVVAECRKYESLLPKLVVNYQRVSWQDLVGSARLTLDRCVSFYRPDGDLWDRQTALERSTLGVATKQLATYILEAKILSRDLPAWLRAALDDAKLIPCEISKFTAGMSATYDG